MKTFFKIFGVLLFCFGTLSAQQVRVEAVIDTAKLRIGEQAKVDIYVTYEASQGQLSITWPSIGDTITSKIEVIDVSPIDTTFPNKTNSTLIHQHQQITISVYDSGFFALPPLKFMVNNKDSLYTNPLFLEVHTLPVDTAQGKFKDIKEPFDEPFNWKWYLPIGITILAIILAAQIAVLLYLRFFKKKINIVDAPAKPVVPPHVLALAELETIKQEALYSKGQVKEYYSAISDCVRTYIEGRFGVNALESTTDEIMTAFRTVVIDKESKEKLQQLLSLSDLVKFAKMSPLETEHVMSLQHAFDFVNGTKREETQQEATEAKEESTGD